MVLFVLALCLPFESFYPYPLFAPFDPNGSTPNGSTPDGIKPEWYFFFVSYPLELLPFWVVLLASLVLGVALLFTPWLFKNTNRRTLGLLGIAMAGYLLLMTVFGDKIYHLFKD